MERILQPTCAYYCKPHELDESQLRCAGVHLLPRKNGKIGKRTNKNSYRKPNHTQTAVRNGWSTQQRFTARWKHKEWTAMQTLLALRLKKKTAVAFDSKTKVPNPMREDLSRAEGSSVSCFFSHVELNIKSAPTSGCVESTTKMSRENPPCLWSRTTWSTTAQERLCVSGLETTPLYVTRLHPRSYRVEDASSNAALKKQLFRTPRNSR